MAPATATPPPRARLAAALCCLTLLVRRPQRCKRRQQSLPAAGCWKPLEGKDEEGGIEEKPRQCKNSCSAADNTRSTATCLGGVAPGARRWRFAQERVAQATYVARCYIASSKGVGACTATRSATSTVMCRIGEYLADLSAVFA